ncbi:MerR family transcriptional regulator [uncultured Brevibacillus sp.]|uniref:MerR family transcriptional regulator n=1 Tax=uncultured Brevibacillus sp. TaxID=169970 RepID=UPI0025991E06|nr:MerR family transcriptional regulator [uncultured Brevibacillus sp.]
MIRVGELAKKTNISKRTLYYYEQIELLKPTLISENGYRYYDENAVLHLQKILLLKSIGYTLEQIKELFQNQNSTKENENWIASLNEQIELIEKKKEELSRKQYYLRSTIHTIQLKGTSSVKDLLQVIETLNDRPLVEGIIPAEFSDDLPFTSREKSILNRFPVLGSNDGRIEELLLILQQVIGMMPASPYSSEAQVVAGHLYEKTLDLFEGDEKLLDKYWELIRPANGEKPVVMGMDSELMAYIDEMISFFLKQREDK